jgi:hypothetical protein
MGVALDAQAAAFVYIYARIPQIAEMTLSFHATDIDPPVIVVAVEKLPLWLAASAVPVLERISFQIRICLGFQAI